MTRDIDGEIVILDRSSGQVHQLNPTASNIWNACDGSHSVDEIAARVAASFENVPDTLLDDVRAVLDDFRRLGLLQSEPQPDV